jgi:hypothetical protein
MERLAIGTQRRFSMSLAPFWANHVFLANPGKPCDYAFLAASGHGLAGFQAVSCLHHQAMLSRQSDDRAERWAESCRPSGAITPNPPCLPGGN